MRRGTVGSVSDDVAELGFGSAAALRDLRGERFVGEGVVDGGVGMKALPSGTVTFLFTDIEESTVRWADDEQGMGDALRAHDDVLRAVVARHGGVVFKHTGDGVCAVFKSASSAVAAAVDAQGELALPVRMGLHTGEAELRDGDYFGSTLNRVARIMHAGHGGQILVSLATDAMVEGVATLDLGEHRLKGLSSPERIFQIGTAEFAPLRVATAAKGNLPAELSGFVGREGEIADLVDRVSEHRLVTLIGIGGTGKSRLSIEAAAGLAPRFPDGCWLVELAPITVGEAVPFAIAPGLGVTLPETGDVLDHVVSRVRHERRLVIVDNCEHILDAAADAIERLLDACSMLSIVATSREALMVRGEQLVAVGSLTTDEALELFLARASDEASGTLDEVQLDAAGRLVDRLDRLPLAIELAAARLRVMTPVEMLAGLDARFTMLTAGRRSRMERHQTMRGTLDWSYELCDDVERSVFDAVSVFATMFDLDAARAVVDSDLGAGEVTEAILRLVERSMIQRVIADDGTSRYLLLETMRAYGREHLAEHHIADEVAGRHAEHIADTVSQLGLASFGPDEDATRAEARRLIPELVPALDWFIAHRKWSRAVRITALRSLADHRVPSALASRLRHAIEAAGDTTELLSPQERFHLHALTGDIDQPFAHEHRGLALDVVRSNQPFADDCILSMPFSVSPTRVDSDYDTWDELVSAADRVDGAPLVVQFLCHYALVEGSLRYTMLGGGTLRAPSSAERLADIVDRLDSERARRYLRGLQALAASLQNDHDTAIRLATESLPDDGEVAYFDIMSAIRLLRWSHEIGRVPSGDEFRRPWQWILDGGYNYLGSIALQGSAAGLDIAGFPNLADRLIARMRTIVPDELFSAYTSLLGEALRERAAVLPPSDEPIDDLVAAVFEAADELDNRAGPNP
jgi:predicted ATPase/class 3 adenylate cyclase